MHDRHVKRILINLGRRCYVRGRYRGRGSRRGRRGFRRSSRSRSVRAQRIGFRM